MPQVIFGPFGPYTLIKSALVGRPASTYSRVPSAMLVRAELLRITGVVDGAKICLVRNEEAEGSNPFSSTKFPIKPMVSERALTERAVHFKLF